MEFTELVNMTSQRQGVTPFEENPGHFIFYLDDYQIACYQRDKFVFIESQLGHLSGLKNTDSLNQHLLTKSLQFIRDKRACLSISDQKQYMLHQRIHADKLTVALFQTSLEQFSSCLQYITDEMKPFFTA
ncbi:MAG: type III secretion system chaperone [Endozoicomonadaceae bacterium]|nr:type III secretion system chaperone [Endozoicomonadaceae bacterium]